MKNPIRAFVIAVIIASMGTVYAGEPVETAGELVKRLGHEDFVIREQATEKLIEMGEAARDALEKAANSADQEVGWRARAILKRMGSVSVPLETQVRSALERLRRNYRNRGDSSEYEKQAYEEISKLGKSVTRVFPKMLREYDNDYKVTRFICAFITNMEAKSLIPDLVDILMTPNYRRQYDVINTVFALDRMATLKALEKALEKGNKSRKVKAMNVMQMRFDELMVPMIKDYLASSDVELRRAAFQVLERTGNVDTHKDLLMKGLEDKDQQVRTSALSALGRAQVPEALEPLLKLVKDEEADYSSRMRAFSVLIRYETIKVKEVYDEILSNKSRKNQNMRNYVLMMLRNVKQDWALDVARELLDSKDANDRRSALYYVRDNQDKESYDKVVKLLSDDDQNVKRAAIEALVALEKDEGKLLDLLGPIARDDRTYAAHRAIQIIATYKDKKVIAILIDALDSGYNASVREALRHLQRITDQYFGNISHYNNRNSKKVIKKWRDWWEKNKDSFEFDE